MAEKDLVEAASVGAALERPVGQKEDKGARTIMILYSQRRDLYRIPSIDKGCWLSVQVYRLPTARLAADAIYLGPSVTADGKGWRKSYSTGWRSILAGDSTTLPANDPMVADYEAFLSPSPISIGERTG
jgi:hypothetical protein